jgi:hypothetical protein
VLRGWRRLLQPDRADVLRSPEAQLTSGNGRR